MFNEAAIVDKKIYDALRQANLNLQINGIETGKVTKDEKINEIMDEDFNTPNLITYLNDLIKELNTKLRSKEDIVETYDKIQLINTILGLKYDLPVLTEDDKKLYNEWLEARNNKDFETADKLRAQLMEKGII